MALTNPVTNQESYIRYLDTVGVQPTDKLAHCMDCGLPAVWLYLKAIGLEHIYFDLITRTKTRDLEFKELFNLMIFTNGENTFFAHMPQDFIIDRIPIEVLDAQIEIAKTPLFEMTFAFNEAQLTEVLEALAKPNVMIRLGIQRKAIGIMFSDNEYHVYHADNSHALRFKSIDKCVDLVRRVINEGSPQAIIKLKVEARICKGFPKPHVPDPRDLFRKFMQQRLALKHKMQSQRR